MSSFRGEMDTASPSGGEDSGFKSRRRLVFGWLLASMSDKKNQNNKKWQKWHMTRPRIELRTFRVLSGRDNQLHHRVGFVIRDSWYSWFVQYGSRHGAVVSTSRLHREGRRFEPGCRYVVLYFWCYCPVIAPVAQWIRRRPSKPEVVGSIPTRGALFFLALFLDIQETRDKRKRKAKKRGG